MTLDININERLAKNANYLKGELLPEEDMIVKIKDVEEQMVENPRNGSSSEEVVLIFEGDVLPLVLGNNTNMRAIKKALKTDKTKEWPGHKLQLYREWGKWFGTNGWAVRIRDFEPK